jgi:thiol:disulfide interchange protein
MKFKPFIIAIIIVLSSVGLFAQAQKQFKATAKADKQLIKKGESFTIKYQMVFNKGWHTYSFKPFDDPEAVGPLASELTIGPKTSLEIKGKISTPKGNKEYDKQFQMDVVTWGGTLDFEIPAVAKKDLDLSKDKIFVNMNVQQCNDRTCLPPENYKTVVGGGSINEENVIDKPSNQEIKADTAKAPKKEESSQKEESQPSIWTTIIIAVAGGAASLLTPCVFPMVPITVSFFTKRVENRKGKGLRDALAYALGIIGTFTGLGLIFSLVFGASGVQTFTSSPAVSIFIAAIFIIFAFSLFGAFELQLPTGLLNKLNAKSQQGSGIGSVLLMGLTFSLASFSCTGPLVGAALVSAAKGNWFYPLISMLTFSTVLAAPFFLLALFPNAMSSLPKAGGWMNNIKVVLAFVLLAVSLKFLNAAFIDWGIGISRDLFLAIWVGCCLLTSLYILGVFRMAHDAPVQGMGVTRVLLSLLFMAFTVYFLAGIMGKPMGFFEGYLPAGEETAQTASIIPTASAKGATEADNIWYDNYQTALEKAKATNKCILIDFSGRHCTNCVLMERNIFPKPKIQELLGKFIKVRLIIDVNEEPYISNKKFEYEHFNTVAMPYYVILTPDEQVLGTSASTTDENEYAQFLQKGVK